ncbi:hemimethylated DNA-binding domain protein [Ceratobasidium sp. AG-Ba]|nr:hemimethylated DNA-binding domain protein [Ceratobasidium sp. AG-Ba]
MLPRRVGATDDMNEPVDDQCGQIIHRAARDLLVSMAYKGVGFESLTVEESNEMEAALYASAMTMFIANPQETQSIQYLEWIITITELRYPLDTETVLRELLRFLLEFKTDDDPVSAEIETHFRNKVIKLRASSVDVKKRKNEKYWVGMIFKDAGTQSLGLIVGRDKMFKADEGLATRAGIDGLSGGRGQPCYTVLGVGGISRYVPEENIVPLRSLPISSEHEHNSAWDVVLTLMQHGMPVIERTFTRVEVDEELGRVWFVPAASTAEEYPEDTTLGEEYMWEA